MLQYTDDWHVFLDKTWQPVKLCALEVHHKTVVAQIEGFSEREQVTYLTNKDIVIPKGRLPALEPGEYYWHELIGMTVINQEGELFGTVVEMMATGSNDVLVIQGEKKHLIPYLPGDYVMNIDDQKKVITVDWDIGF